jgi:hypothetical protein
MHLLGKSEFGSTFFTVEALDVETKDKAKRQFILLKHSRSWQIENFYFGLHLISLSLQNILSYLKIVNGVEPSQVQFAWPDDETHFQEPWKTHPSISGISMNNIITAENITPFSNEQILSVYKKETKAD